MQILNAFQLKLSFRRIKINKWIKIHNMLKKAFLCPFVLLKLPTLGPFQSSLSRLTGFVNLFLLCEKLHAILTISWN